MKPSVDHHIVVVVFPVVVVTDSQKHTFPCNISFTLSTKCDVIRVIYMLHAMRADIIFCDVVDILLI